MAMLKQLFKGKCFYYIIIFYYIQQYIIYIYIWLYRFYLTFNIYVYIKISFFERLLNRDYVLLVYSILSSYRIYVILIIIKKKHKNK